MAAAHHGHHVDAERGGPAILVIGLAKAGSVVDEDIEPAQRLDGLRDDAEVFTYGTDPNKADSDGDGLSDGDEVTRQTDPLDLDTDDDGLEDGEEVATYGTDPKDSDSDDDGLEDGGQHVVRTDVAEHAVAFGDRQSGRGDDVGFLNLFAHFLSVS